MTLLSVIDEAFFFQLFTFANKPYTVMYCMFGEKGQWHFVNSRGSHTSARRGLLPQWTRKKASFIEYFQISLLVIIYINFFYIIITSIGMPVVTSVGAFFT